MTAIPQAYIDWVVASLLLSLRVAPVLTFAPPFTLVRMPALFRLLLGLALSGLMVGSGLVADGPPIELGALVQAGLNELVIGAIIVFAFQAAFAAIYVAGRTVDIQSGFGLASVVDPTSGVQTPLVGSIYAYAAGAVFFGMDGHLDLMRMLAASLEILPLGGDREAINIAAISAFLATVFAIAFGVAGGVILALFITDLAIALLSRTAPQLNVLVLGFQVKTVLVMVALPLTLGTSAALLARLGSTTLGALPVLMS